MILKRTTSKNLTGVGTVIILTVEEHNGLFYGIIFLMKVSEVSDLRNADLISWIEAYDLR